MLGREESESALGGSDNGKKTESKSSIEKESGTKREAEENRT